MKIRILNNSIRLRLSQLEVAQLAEGKKVEGKVPFPDGSVWIYGLQPQDQPELFQVRQVENGILIAMDKKAGEQLFNTDHVGHEAHLTTPDSSLKILVEKDFKCLTPRDEEESGLFENPNSVC